jgi:CheY-like chemotaxis protein/HPt (histidine-containing phosphotransfer) domain-containing protein
MHSDDLRRIGISGLLYKPFTPGQLASAIVRVLSGAASDGPGSTEEFSVDVSGDREALQGARILLVEDNRLNQEVATNFLRSVGVQVEHAGNGREALERLAVADYDAVLMDCQMPVMDGYEAAKRIRTLPALAGLPVIAMTAHAMRGDRERSLAAGMNDHLTKPIDRRELYRTLRHWLRREEAAATPAGEPQSASTSPAAEAGEAGPSGFDVHGALHRLGGDRETYRLVLELFAADEADFDKRFASALAAGDLAAATRFAHTLKGLAASAGATGLSEAARALEYGCREGIAGETIAERQEAVAIALDEALAAIAAHFRQR